MSVKNSLTNEKVAHRFDNPFNLVNYAIDFAHKRIALGDFSEANLSSEILESIADGSDISEMEDLRNEERLREEEYLAEKAAAQPRHVPHEKREELAVRGR